MEISNLIPHIEALIFASEKPLTTLEITELINNAFGFMEDKITLDQIESAMEGILEKYRAEFYPFEVRESGGGWQFLTKKDFHKTVAQLNGDKFMKRLSTAALETLSIIAYKQPVTKAEIEAIRGVSSDYAIQKLLEKDLIVITGRNEKLPGHPLVYGTSKNFMDYFGLNSPDDLPKLKEVFDDNIVAPTVLGDEGAAGEGAEAAAVEQADTATGETGEPVSGETAEAITAEASEENATGDTSGEFTAGEAAEATTEAATEETLDGPTGEASEEYTAGDTTDEDTDSPAEEFIVETADTDMHEPSSNGVGLNGVEMSTEEDSTGEATEADDSFEDDMEDAELSEEDFDGEEEEDEEDFEGNENGEEPDETFSEEDDAFSDDDDTSEDDYEEDDIDESEDTDESKDTDDSGDEDDDTTTYSVGQDGELIEEEHTPPQNDDPSGETDNEDKADEEKE
jgi:segregation and condensation protein B